MGEARRRNLVPAGVIIAVLLSIAVTWAFRDEQTRELKCAALYAAAATATDTAAIDSTVVSTGWTSAPVTCGDLRAPRR